MERIESDEDSFMSAAMADDAVGVSGMQRFWYVAVVNNRAEKKSAVSISKSGYSSFVPVRTERHQRSDGSARMVERVLVAASVFVYCTERERREIVQNPVVKRFMVDRSRGPVNGRHPISVVPEEQMQVFRSLIEFSDDNIEVFPSLFESGDQIRIVKGGLNGVEGRVISSERDSVRIAVALGTFGSAVVNVNKGNICRI